MLISIIIPAHNEENYIGKALESITNQNYNRRDIEIIVVADSCTDNTVNIANSYNPDLIIEVKYRNIAKVKSAGAKSANGDILLFIDADHQFKTKRGLSVVSNRISSGKPNPVIGTLAGYLQENNWKACLFWKVRNFIFKLGIKKGAKFLFIEDADAGVKISMRRYEEEGYLKTLWWWTIEAIRYQLNLRSRKQKPIAR